MRFRRIAECVLLVCLLGAGAAFAQRNLSPYQAPMSDQDTQTVTVKGTHYQLYDAQVQEKPKPFPIIPVTLSGLVLLVALPFAIKYYLVTSRELDSSRERVVTDDFDLD